MDTLSRDRGSIVIGWLTKLIVVLAVVGVMLFDALSVSAARVGAEDDANQAAEAAGFEWCTTHDVQQAYQAALDALPSDSESIPAKSFVIDTSGTVRLVVHRLTRTMIVQHIGPLKRFMVVTAHGESQPPTL
jgi:hypothetical protein